MGLKERYEKAFKKLTEGSGICNPNQILFKKFFAYEEYKLKRKNSIPSIDESSYKTLLAYLTRLRTVNNWFNNKPWIYLTKKDIKQVYDNLEEGRIISRFGTPIKDKATYYKQILRSKPFELAGKKELVKRVMEFYSQTSKEEVRFITEETFRKLVDTVIKIEHKAFLWIAWDIGENCNSLLQIKVGDFTRQVNEDTNEAEYLVNLRKEILKRSRTPRSEFTNYKENVYFLDLVLKSKKPEEFVFNFGYRMAKKIIERAMKLTGARCNPTGQNVTLKDLRSSMACDLLRKGWTTDEVNCRLGHKPSSHEIDKYVNFLAMDRRKPKKKIFDNALQKIQEELEESKQREKLTTERLKRQSEESQDIKHQLHLIMERFGRLTKQVQELTQYIA